MVERQMKKLTHLEEDKLSINNLIPAELFRNGNPNVLYIVNLRSEDAKFWTRKGKIQKSKYKSTIANLIGIVPDDDLDFLSACDNQKVDTKKGTPNYTRMKNIKKELKNARQKINVVFMDTDSFVNEKGDEKRKMIFDFLEKGSPLEKNKIKIVEYGKERKFLLEYFAQESKNGIQYFNDVYIREIFLKDKKKELKESEKELEIAERNLDINFSMTKEKSSQLESNKNQLKSLNEKNCLLQKKLKEEEEKYNRIMDEIRRKIESSQKKMYFKQVEEFKLRISEYKKKIKKNKFDISMIEMRIKINKQFVKQETKLKDNLIKNEEDIQGQLSKFYLNTESKKYKEIIEDNKKEIKNLKSSEQLKFYSVPKAIARSTSNYERKKFSIVRKFKYEFEIEAEKNKIVIIHIYKRQKNMNLEKLYPSYNLSDIVLEKRKPENYKKKYGKRIWKKDWKFDEFEEEKKSVNGDLRIIDYSLKDVNNTKTYTGYVKSSFKNLKVEYQLYEYEKDTRATQIKISGIQNNIENLNQKIKLEKEIENQLISRMKSVSSSISQKVEKVKEFSSEIDQLKNEEKKLMGERKTYESGLKNDRYLLKKWKKSFSNIDHEVNHQIANQPMLIKIEKKIIDLNIEKLENESIIAELLKNEQEFLEIIKSLKVKRDLFQDVYKVKKPIFDQFKIEAEELKEMVKERKNVLYEMETRVCFYVLKKLNENFSKIKGYKEIFENSLVKEFLMLLKSFLKNHEDFLNEDEMSKLLEKHIRCVSEILDVKEKVVMKDYNSEEEEEGDSESEEEEVIESTNLPVLKIDDGKKKINKVEDIHVNDGKKKINEDEDIPPPPDFDLEEEEEKKIKIKKKLKKKDSLLPKKKKNVRGQDPHKELKERLSIRRKQINNEIEDEESDEDETKLMIKNN